MLCECEAHAFRRKSWCECVYEEIYNETSLAELLYLFLIIVKYTAKMITSSVKSAARV